jgi:redox-sensitive bicupin YhaK (pirin superfamily)
MSGTLPANPPQAQRVDSGLIELVIEARTRDLGGFEVRRVLPASARRLIGPFIFFDQMGPAALPVGAGLDVRPHPHIALATVTYLFEGEIMHRDSLGSVQAIRPGDVNWMVAGRGIAHSERSSPEQRQLGPRLHGIQSWVALPMAAEECEPAFEHHPARTIPVVQLDGSRIDVIAGTAFGARSPVRVQSPTLYAHVQMEPGARLRLDTEHEERAIYVVEGSVNCDGRDFAQGALVVFRSGIEATIETIGPVRAMILGGAKLEGERHVFWNFVSSSLARIERAKDDWKAGRFPKVVGDEVELIPLPEG